MRLPKPSSCNNCYGMCWDGDGYVPADGSGESGVLVILEAAGEAEADEGRPTVGKAGHYLWSNLARVGIERDQFRVHNVLSCQPKDNKLAGMPFEQQVIQHCAPNLDATIADMQKRCQRNGKHLTIVALGKIAVKRTLGLKDDSPILKGDYLAYPFWAEKYQAHVVCGQHPSYLMRGNSHLQPILQFVFKRALDIAEHGLPVDEPSLLLDPEPMAFESWVRDYLRYLHNHPETVLSYDIETPFKQGKSEEEVAKEDDEDYTILRCSFSYLPHEAVSVPWRAEYISSLGELFIANGRKLGWNLRYDSPRVRAQLPINGAELDAMLAWHILNSSLPKSLGFVTPFYNSVPMWKHKADQDLAKYNCLSYDTNVVLWDGTTKQIYEVVKKRLPLTLRGMDENGHAIPVKIVDWHRQIVKGQTWVQIKTAGTRQAIICTPDHRIWTKEHGWRRADELDGTETMYSSRFGHPSLIHGMILGDSAITPRGRLTLGHGMAQTEYFDLKHRNLDATSPCIAKAGYGGTCWISDAWVPKFWRERFHVNGKKQFVPPPDDAALAIWYCDDGCLASHKYPRLAIYFGNNPEAFSWLRSQFGRVSEYNKRHNGSVASMLDTETFFTRVAPYVPPCMDYKLPDKYKGQYNGWLDTPTPQETKIEWIKNYSDQNPRRQQSKKNVRFCVTVDHPTHRFMTIGGLVSNCLDALYTLRNFNGIAKDLKDNNLWQVFERHVVKLDEVLAYMSSKGIVRDEVKRQEAETRLSSLLAASDKAMEAVVPVEAKQLKVYKKAPKVTEGLLQVDGELAEIVCLKCGEVRPKKVHAAVCDGEKGKLPYATKLWAKPLPFKVSKVSLTRYQKLRKHQAVIDRRDSKTTFDVRAIEALVKRYPNDPLYSLIHGFRKYQKLLGAYVGVTDPDTGRLKGGMKADIDGRIHCQYSHNPSTLRLACANPNMQQIPQRGGELAKMVRNIIAAGPGCKLVELDFSAIEAVLTGFFAQDPAYIRLAKMGIHSYLASHVLGRPADLKWSDSDLEAYFKEIKKSDDEYVKLIYNGSKRAIHLSAYGGTPRKMNLAEPEVFKTVKEAERLQRMYFDLFPSVKKWQSAVQLQADRDGYLRNVFGYIHRFHAVFKYVKVGNEWQREPGDDANRVLAFQPQSTASGIIKECMLRLYFDRFEDAGQFLRLQVHDSLVSEVPANLVEKVVAIKRDEMTKPIPQLRMPASWGLGDYLSVGVEAKVGEYWGEAH